jgi:hypothetical protein
MNKVGLLFKRDEYYTGEMFGLYEQHTASDSAEWKHAFRHIQEVRECPPIKFIGVWDTVGALGVPGLLGKLVNKDKYDFHNVDLTPEIENAYHALAIDEQRKPFMPSLWTRPDGWKGILEQVWFAGVHSNVDGSYSPDGLANEALHWMVEKAEALELEFNEPYLNHYLPCFNSVLNDSMTAMYKVFGPNHRKLGMHANDGEAIHQSVLDRMNLPVCQYKPDSLLDYLKLGTPKVANTTRIARGTPCADITK